MIFHNWNLVCWFVFTDVLIFYSREDFLKEAIYKQSWKFNSLFRCLSFNNNYYHKRAGIIMINQRTFQALQIATKNINDLFLFCKNSACNTYKQRGPINRAFLEVSLSVFTDTASGVLSLSVAGRIACLPGYQRSVYLMWSLPDSRGMSAWYASLAGGYTLKKKRWYLTSLKKY